MKGENMRQLIFIVLLVAVIIIAGCLSGSNEKNTNPIKTQTPIPMLTPTLNVTELVFAYQNQIKNTSTKIDCTPPRLKSGFKEFETQFLKQDSLNCTGIGAPV